MARQTDLARPRARKRFGQHFLEPAWARKVVAAIAPQPDEVFLEIGPGPGAITRSLASAARGLLASEIDRNLAERLRQESIPGVRVVEGDFLRMSLEQLRAELAAVAPGIGPFRVAGNLPYNIASPIMFRLLEMSRLGLPLVDATVMLQREVADRLLAKPGTGDYGVLTVLVGHRASVDRLLNLPPGAFRPPPRVRSSIVRLRFHQPEPEVADEGTLAAVTNAVFSRRRKTMGNAMLAYGGVGPAAAAHALERAGIEPVRRPETLSIAEFVRVANAITAVRESPSQSPNSPVL
jgi:16S rRNA (adenine1518-N6/adenine1519-N6)-dimethyltransferase